MSQMGKKGEKWERRVPSKEGGGKEGTFAEGSTKGRNTGVCVT